MLTSGEGNKTEIACNGQRALRRSRGQPGESRVTTGRGPPGVERPQLRRPDGRSPRTSPPGRLQGVRRRRISPPFKPAGEGSEPAAGPAPGSGARGRGGTSASQGLLPVLVAIPVGANRSGPGLAGELG